MALQIRPEALDENHFAANRLLGMVFVQRQDYRQAEPYLARAIALNGNDASLLQNHALVLLALKRPLDALRCADRALVLKPDYPLALNARGNALMVLGRSPPMRSRSMTAP